MTSPRPWGSARGRTLRRWGDVASGPVPPTFKATVAARAHAHGCAMDFGGTPDVRGVARDAVRSMLLGAGGGGAPENERAQTGRRQTTQPVGRRYIVAEALGTGRS
jgi:hypothetical protein